MLSREQFVQLVKESFEKTALKPTQGYFYFDGSGAPGACAIAAVVLARQSMPDAPAEIEWTKKAEVILAESAEFIDGVTAGFDGDEDYTLDSPDFQRGVHYGRAAAVALDLIEEGAQASPLQVNKNHCDRSLAISA